MSKFRIWSSTAAALLLMWSGGTQVLCAQTLSPADDSIFSFHFRQAKQLRMDTLPIGERVAAVGKMFLGTPYVAGTLDTGASSETLILNLRGFDCVTFYENSLALALALRAEAPSDAAYEFQHVLPLLRYRGRAITGYASRLHYTTDWFCDNTLKGIVQNVTKEVGGRFAIIDHRTIDFMSRHRSAYRQLADDASYNSIVAMERNINSRGGFYYIPKEHIVRIEKQIHTGDILGITTNIAGLDCSHTGIAVRMQDGRIHFMHASSLMGKVIISVVPLAEYLTHSTHQTGIIVARPREVDPQFDNRESQRPGEVLDPYIQQ